MVRTHIAHTTTFKHFTCCLRKIYVYRFYVFAEPNFNFSFYRLFLTFSLVFCFYFSLSLTLIRFLLKHALHKHSVWIPLFSVAFFLIDIYTFFIITLVALKYSTFNMINSSFCCLLLLLFNFPALSLHSFTDD